MMNLKKVSIVVTLLFLTSCVETVVVGSVATGVVASREKSLTNSAKDIAISSKLGAAFIKNGLKNPGNSIDVTVNEGRVLLTGIARDAKKANLAADLAWKVKGVTEVIDEIQMVDEEKIQAKDWTSAANDYFITAQIETKLLFHRKILSVNYQVTTVKGMVYLLGVAEDDLELQKVLALVSKTRGVKKVVNHIILFNDSRRKR